MMDKKTTNRLKKMYEEIEIDLAQDRDEFERRVKSNNCATKLYSQEQILLALVNDDTDFLQRVKDADAACRTRISNYLQAWDNAEDEAGRRQVVGSVKAFTLDEIE